MDITYTELVLTILHCWICEALEMRDPDLAICIILTVRIAKTILKWPTFVRILYCQRFVDFSSGKKVMFHSHTPSLGFSPV